MIGKRFFNGGTMGRGYSSITVQFIDGNLELQITGKNGEVGRSVELTPEQQQQLVQMLPAVIPAPPSMPMWEDYE